VRVTNYCGSANSETAIITVIELAENITSVSGDCQSGVVSEALAYPFVVEVTDGDGVPVSGVEVDWAITRAPLGATGQSLSATMTVTGLDGKAETRLTLGNKAGAYGVQAALGTEGEASTIFTATTGPSFFLKAGLYHKFSIPYQLANGNALAVLNELGPYSPSSWRLFHYEGGLYQEYPYCPVFSPGLGFWLISAQDAVIYVEGVDPGNVTVTLQPGWNQVGCPYDCAVSWEMVKEANPEVFSKGDVADVVWGYDSEKGEYVMSTHLEPWQGYWVYNYTNLPILEFVIPNPKGD